MIAASCIFLAKGSAPTTFSRFQRRFLAPLCIVRAPAKLAMGLILTGRTIDAAEAARLGLVNQVVPRADLAATAQQWIDDILLCAPLAVQASKAVARDSAAYPHLREAIGASYAAAERMLASEDAVEGPRAFADKRLPNWTGRLP